MQYGQMSGVTGLRKRPSYTDIINAENVSLPNKVQGKKDREFQEQTQKFNEDQAAWERQQADKQHLLEWQTAHDARKQQNMTNNLGYANLGLNVLGETGALGDLYDSVMGLF